MSAVLTWSIAAGMIAGILFRPRDWPEAVWACLGAVLLVLCRLLSPESAWRAIGKGTDVYLFLAGMMFLSELARREGVFDWLASHAVRAARGSRTRLFALVYAVGILVTVFLSNDATAVVLTPAVYAAVKKAKTAALPYLLSCAFIANAASFVLPISNPANLVVYGKQLPPLIPWLKVFLLPSLISIAVTFLMLRLISRDALKGKTEDGVEVPELSTEGLRAAWGIGMAGAVLISASALGMDLGLPTFVAAVAAVLLATRANAKAITAVARAVSWSVLPLVAGLFVLVEALDNAGALRGIRAAIHGVSGLPPLAGSLSASFGVAVLSNIMNNLPSGLLTGSALQGISSPDHIRHAILVGVDLGPNLSVTGSLATVLWLIALRREGEHVSAWTFLKAGVFVMPPALLLATAAIVVGSG
ncbi:MAG: Arsenical pump rane protein [Bryobacterales bacterium]|nr:Arsenical pump rane protein [Bryobacterales bacterium]